MVRIIPPRATCTQDITEPEKKLMDDHYAYWGAPYEQGICLAGGAVLDRAGVYGVLIVRAFNEDEARALANAELSVKGGLIHTIVAEMILSLTPAAAAATSKP